MISMNVNEPELSISEKLQILSERTYSNGQIWRPSYSDSYLKGAALVKSWMIEAGLKVYEDSVGNIYGRLEGEIPEVILTGSHLDTVKNGGAYDGAAGIITSIHAVGELLKEKGRPRKTIEIVAMVEEEGSRFDSSYIGSKAITGKLAKADLEEKDEHGVTLHQAMKAAGYYPGEIETAVRTDVKAFIEMHVEQGPVLESKGKAIGIVSGIVGIYSYRITVDGTQNHAGTTPMKLRVDPVVAVSEFISSLTDYVASRSDTATFTVGDIQVVPGMSNVIAKQVCLLLDFRDGVGGIIDRIDEEMRRKLKELEENGFEIHMEKKCDEKPVALSEELIQILTECAESRSIPYLHMNSGAGHDAQIFADRIPTGMIFVPSRNGVSHSPDEYTEEAELETGKEVLKSALYQLSY